MVGRCAPFEFNRGPRRLWVRLVGGTLAQLNVRTVRTDPQEHALACPWVLPQLDAVACARGVKHVTADLVAA